MKKSVMLMVGILAVSLTGSAQAAGSTMFAVQDATGTSDMATISDTGDIAGNKLTVTSNVEGGLSKVPLGAGPALTAGQGVFHFATEGLSYLNSSFLVQHVATEANHATFPGVYSGATAPNFSFYRINKFFDGTYVLPTANNSLGYFNFGTIDTAVSPATSKRNIAIFAVKAEGTWPALTSTPTYFSWSSTLAPATVLPSEKMRLTSGGSLGIGTIAPTSKLQVVGLPVFADNATALAGGLTAGAFYRTATGVLMVAF